MPWKETRAVDERVQFVALYRREKSRNMSALCEAFGVSRKTGYKWLKRYEEGGPAALEDRSRAPIDHPNAVTPGTRELLLEERRLHPTWGPLKIQASVGRKHPELALPAPSTIGELLKREGLVKPRMRRRRTPPCTQPFAEVKAPNSVWCVDFKGDFRLGNRTRCYPLTVTDSYSRYLLCCYGLKGTSGEPVQRVLTRVFREFGLPDAWRSDNGTPFASIGIAGLSRLSVWLVKLGIQLERIDPGRPEQNGRHERMHRTLKAEATRPARRSAPAQQKTFDRFRREFNEERPHEALGQETLPASMCRRQGCSQSASRDPTTTKTRWSAGLALQGVSAGSVRTNSLDGSSLANQLASPRSTMTCGTCPLARYDLVSSTRLDQHRRWFVSG